MTKDEFMRRADDAIYMNNLSLLQGDVDALFGELERLRDRASEDADRLHKAVAEVERLRAERDEARDAYKFRGGYVEDASGDRWWSADLLSKVEQERDAARAEVERLREHFEAASPEHNLPALLDLYDARRTTAEDERDEARAEVERLRAECSKASAIERQLIAAWMLEQAAIEASGDGLHAVAARSVFVALANAILSGAHNR